jgi:hypothetical protein
LFECGQQPRFVGVGIIPGRSLVHGAIRARAGAALQYC